MLPGTGNGDEIDGLVRGGVGGWVSEWVGGWVDEWIDGG